MDEAQLKIEREKAFAQYGKICQSCGSEFQVFAVIRIGKKPLILCEVCNQKYRDNRERTRKRLCEQKLIPFGKFKGRLVSECPIDYLRWLRNEKWLEEWLRKETINFLENCPGEHRITE